MAAIIVDAGWEACLKSVTPTPAGDVLKNVSAFFVDKTKVATPLELDGLVENDLEWDSLTVMEERAFAEDLQAHRGAFRTH